MVNNCRNQRRASKRAVASARGAVACPRQQAVAGEAAPSRAAKRRARAQAGASAVKRIASQDIGVALADDDEEEDTVEYISMEVAGEDHDSITRGTKRCTCSMV
jgi:hypothetical protein